ncbi:proteinase inhibitor type-2 TR8-like isoform X1 [Solanum pennellii]|uniref:Proteinase inhibitor type-2 TR8-like isoform X1 n=1 Tax=Solanum pennellii TaxID=28526 RepID=A0ABM1FMJ3_SOLPN|nr:proteinase inhibitor type-2 TR8-like isoform X1 [Solanum pennellii]
MAILKVALLLLLGIILLVSNVEHTNAKACTKQCDPRIAFGICPHLQTKRINQICTNCCAGKKGCKYFSADGTFICEGESEYVSEVDDNLEKHCPRNCDPRIAYAICPRSEISNKIDLNGICTNCCAGKKGCHYFSADGTFICEGESEFVSEVDNNLGKPCP